MDWSIVDWSIINIIMVSLLCFAFANLVLMMLMICIYEVKRGIQGYGYDDEPLPKRRN